ncbi:MAG: sensor histidine kinase [Eubacteriales bacterium]
MDISAKKYPKTAVKALMTAGMFASIFLTIVGILLTAVALSGNFYENYPYEILDNVNQILTQNKTYDVYREFTLVQRGSQSEYQCSQDYKGRTAFRYQIVNTQTGETFGSYVPDASYSSIYTYTNDPYEMTGYRLEDGMYTKKLTDTYVLAELTVNIVYPLRYTLPFLTLLFFLCALVLFGRLMRAAGHKNGAAALTLSWMDRIPLDLAAAILICMLPLYVLVHDAGMRRLGTELADRLHLPLLLLFGVWMLVLFYCFFHTLAVRFKFGRFWENTVLWRVLKLLRIIIRAVYQKIQGFFGMFFTAAGGFLRRAWALFCMIPLAWRTILLAIAVPCYLFLAILCLDTELWGFWLLTILALGVGVYALLIYSAGATHRIEQAIRAMANGDITKKTDTSKFYFIFKKQAEGLNALSDGLQAAVQAQMKSERFKTELITNVSHDIKTPLTSILNYSDLLLAEKPEGKSGEYAEVIYRQSLRLKKLTEDLLEASKASSGSINIEFELIELNQMLHQAVGEYEERLNRAGLTLVCRFLEEDVVLSADGKLLWRVFDNLLSNIVKYSMPGTRVYITLNRAEDRAVVSFKNISRETLEMNTEELLERFVRGDASRHSEGSGLGLNIAQSLCELMHGRLGLSCDGDLFRVDVDFPVIE